MINSEPVQGFQQVVLKAQYHTVLTNTLATRKNLFEWPIGQSSACSFCLQSETLQHVVSSCKLYLDQGRYTWRHDSVLNFIASTLSALPSCSIYADRPAFLSPSLSTGDSLQPDLLLISKTKLCTSLNLPFETKMKVNSDRRALKYNPLHQDLCSKYSQIKFTNLSLGALGTVGSSSDSFIELLKAVDFDGKMRKAILSRIMNITIRCTYFIFCFRNKPWTIPKLHGT